MFTFPKSARILKPHEYRNVRQHGVQRVGKYIILQVLAEKESRLGLSAPRQYGKAHIRNKFKRRMKEVFRATRHSYRHAVHIKPRPFARDATFQELFAEYQKLMASIV